jgi:organic radical activating enzyme
MYIDQVVIEITRRCNMKCPHCLRGEPESKDIPDRILDRFFQKIKGDRLGSITITGGEPSLAPSRIKEITRLAKLYRVDIDYFYLVTNGKKTPYAFLESLVELYDYCQEKDASSVVVSNDRYHEDVPVYNSRLDGYPFFHGKRDTDRWSINDSMLIKQGRAQRIGSRDLLMDTFRIEDDILADSLFYLNVLGKVLAVCDLSYESQRLKKYILGDVFDPDFSLVSCAKSWNRKYSRLIKQAA